MKLIYIANIVVAGWISITSVFFPKIAVQTVFENNYPNSELIRLVGCLWFSIFVLSIFGLYKPITFAPILLVQFIYKSLWLVMVAIPAIQKGINYPKGMALFFVIWIVVLPFVIPWKTLFLK